MSRKFDRGRGGAEHRTLDGAACGARGLGACNAGDEILAESVKMSDTCVRGRGRPVTLLGIHMAIDQHDRRRFLEALLAYAHESRTFNPHFNVSVMLQRLDTDEGTFNILVDSLGPQYCRFVDAHGGENRFAINLSECHTLMEQYRLQDKEAFRHRIVPWDTFAATVLGALLGALLTLLTRITI